MTADQVRELINAEPFQPFSIHMSSGRTIEVAHPEFVLVSPQGRSLVVYGEDDVARHVDMLHITELETHSRKSRRKGNGSTGKGKKNK